MEPWNLIFQHKYAEVAAAYNEILKDSPDDKLALAARASALLCMGNLRDANSEFARANELDKRKSGGESSGYSDDLAVTHWLLAERSEAMLVLKEVIDGLRTNRVQYADLAGGASHGLLLWYMALIEEDDGSKEYSLAFLDELVAKRALSKCWPRILALFVLDRVTFDEVLIDIGESRRLWFIERRARKDLHVRDQLCKAKFYLGAKQLERGKEIDYRKLLAECAALENPIIVPEWFIAKSVTEGS